MNTPLRLFVVSIACVLALGARGVEGVAREANEAALQDCNGNGVDDAVDIALGSSSDSNLDGIPDECQDDRAGES